MAADKLQVGDLIFIDFDTIILRVDSLNRLKGNGYIICSVLSGGVMGNNKAVTVPERNLNLPALSEKDVKTIEIAKKYKINFCSMSFVDSVDDVLELKKLYPQIKVVAKIETEKGVNNLGEILDGIMDGHIIFALDQQQYLQGYLPVVLMNLYITNKNTPAYKKLETGPSTS